MRNTVRFKKHWLRLLALGLCLLLTTATPALGAKQLASPKCKRYTTKTTQQAKPAATPAPTVTSKGGLADEVVRQVNAERRKAGLKELTVSAELTRAAKVRAAEIVQKFSHTRPDGTSWSTVSSSAYGENIAMGQKTADKVMAAWMSSSGHRANILRSSFGSIGVCAVVSGGVTYWVQLFGK